MLALVHYNDLNEQLFLFVFSAFGARGCGKSSMKRRTTPEHSEPTQGPQPIMV